MTSLVIPTVTKPTDALELAYDLALYGRVADASHALAGAISKEETEEGEITATLLKLVNLVADVVPVAGFDEKEANAVLAMVGCLLKAADQGEGMYTLKDRLYSLGNAIETLKEVIE